MIIRVPRNAVFAAIVAGGAFWVAGTAEASFPGANGRIVFGAFFSSEDGTISKLRAVNPRTKRRVRFAPRCTRPCDQRAPAASSNGRQVLFEEIFPPSIPEGSTSTTVAVANWDGTRVREILDSAYEPTWSPSGRALAVIMQRDGIHIVRPDGTEVRKVTSRGAADLDWSVRSEIVFSDVIRTRSNLYTVRPGGAGLRRLTRNGMSDQPSWSPNGRKLIFRRRIVDGKGRFVRFEIRTMRADGTQRRRIARGATSPVWSPNGKRIAYSRGSRIVTADPDGGRRRVVYRVPRVVAGSVAGLAWQPR